MTTLCKLLLLLLLLLVNLERKVRADTGRVARFCVIRTLLEIYSIKHADGTVEK
jgi:hypothetical protein